MAQLDKAKELFKTTVAMYSESVPSRAAAALAYRGIFSLAPLLLITVLIVSLFVGKETAQEEIGEMVDTVLDEESAEMVEQTVRVMFWSTEKDLTITSLIGIGILLYGASSLFREAKIALHTVWGLPPTPRKGLLSYVISQVVSVSMVFVIGFMILAVIVLNIVLSILESTVLQGQYLSLAWASSIVSLFAMTLLICLLFRLVPDVSLPWSDLWVGALVTSLLMMAGAWGISVYVSFSDVGSAAGTAGAIVVLLLGSYYAAHVFLIGASFSGAYALVFGSKTALKELEQFDHPEGEDETNAPTPPP